MQISGRQNCGGSNFQMCFSSEFTSLLSDCLRAFWLLYQCFNSFKPALILITVVGLLIILNIAIVLPMISNFGNSFSNEFECISKLRIGNTFTNFY